VRYLRGSEALGLEAKAYATVISVDSERNEITVKKADGRFLTYDPARVKGVAVKFLDEHGNINVSLDDSGRTVAWNLNQHRHIHHAYAMTSHSSQGITVDRVLIHIDTGDSRTRALVDETLAYVATSRPRYDAQIFTDNAQNLAPALSRKQHNATALSQDEIGSYAMAL
jgi:ATP-dependent exoDNAse (exonuclease V) alpha subunit